MADADVSIDLKPGDHLSITFYQLEPESMKEVCLGLHILHYYHGNHKIPFCLQASEAQTHPSLEQRRPNQVTLGECLSVFSQK